MDAPLSLLRELRGDALLGLFHKERNGHSWATWMVTFPYLAGWQPTATKRQS